MKDKDEKMGYFSEKRKENLIKKQTSKQEELNKKDRLKKDLIQSRKQRTLNRYEKQRQREQDLKKLMKNPKDTRQKEVDLFFMQPLFFF